MTDMTSYESDSSYQSSDLAASCVSEEDFGTSASNPFSILLEAAAKLSSGLSPEHDYEDMSCKKQRQDTVCYRVKYPSGSQVLPYCAILQPNMHPVHSSVLYDTHCAL
mmetsp:Transcript_32556/g.33200  ORF Transcript_32556/g.33200 Transcript_32556/m.33200 type:complete len:108 (-) Transcript_32556:248-571(-)